MAAVVCASQEGLQAMLHSSIFGDQNRWRSRLDTQKPRNDCFKDECCPQDIPPPDMVSFWWEMIELFKNTLHIAQLYMAGLLQGVKVASQARNRQPRNRVRVTVCNGV